MDMALRKFQSFFRMPGEAQKIERLMEVRHEHALQCVSVCVCVCVFMCAHGEHAMSVFIVNTHGEWFWLIHNECIHSEYTVSGFGSYTMSVFIVNTHGEWFWLVHNECVHSEYTVSGFLACTQ